MDTVAIFADVQNIYYTVKQRHGAHFDYNTFLREATAGRKLVQVTAYATDKGDLPVDGGRSRRDRGRLQGAGGGPSSPRLGLLVFEY